MKRIAVLLAVASAAVALIWHGYIAGEFDLLHQTRDKKVTVNGSAMQADVLAGRASALLTLRGRGREHSYLLLYAGDVDSKGDIGNVLHCHSWVAPRTPVLIETKRYPNCTRTSYVPIIAHGLSQEFIGMNGEIVAISLR